MGQAKQKLIDASKIVEFDFRAPSFLVTKQNIAEFVQQKREDDPDYAETAATNDELKTKICGLVIREFVGAKFKNIGMGKEDRRLWAVWQELIDTEVVETKLPKSSIKWLRGLLTDDSVKIQPAFAHASEALLDYLQELETKEAS